MIALREYQRTALDRLRLSYKAGSRACLLVSPTGSGKTVMLATVVTNHVAKGGTVNWYAHRRELTGQAADTLRAFGLGVAHQGLNEGAPVRVLSVQGVLASGQVPECSMAVFDEAHHFGAAAEEWSKVTEAHKSSIIVGATATPQRGDGTPLSPPFDDLIVVAQVSDLIRLGHLAAVESIHPSKRLKTGQIAQRPVDMYELHANGQSAVVFAQHVSAAKTFADEFREKGHAVAIVTGTTPIGEREESLARFAAGEIRVLVNVFVLTEGWDCPRTSCVIIARSVGSQSMYLQMVGRGMRIWDGKRHCTLLDLVGAIHTFGHVNEDREFSLDGDGITRKGVAALGIRLCRTCQEPLGDAIVCESCGKDHSLEPPIITGEKIDKFATVRKKTPEERVNQLVRWMRDALAKGHRVESVFYKARAVYEGQPPIKNEWKTAVYLSKQPQEPRGY